MKMKVELTLTELGKAVETLMGELKRLGLNMSTGQAYTVVNALVSLFRDAGKGKDDGEGGGPD